MILRIIGAVFIFASCLGLGLYIAANTRREIKYLKSLVNAQEFMICELQHKAPALADLSRRTAQECYGRLRDVFLNLADELESNFFTDATQAMDKILRNVSDIPSYTQNALHRIGNSLGYFDMDGQVQRMQSVLEACRLYLQQLMRNSDSRIRQYQTLGLCAGAALIILLI